MFPVAHAMTGTARGFHATPTVYLLQGAHYALVVGVGMTAHHGSKMNASAGVHVVGREDVEVDTDVDVEMEYADDRVDDDEDRQR